METLLLGERPPLVVCLKAPEPQICVLWGAQFVNPSLVKPTSEDGKILSFARYICIGLLQATVVVHPECLTLVEVAVP